MRNVLHDAASAWRHNNFYWYSCDIDWWHKFCTFRIITVQSTIICNFPHKLHMTKCDGLIRLGSRSRAPQGWQTSGEVFRHVTRHCIQNGRRTPNNAAASFWIDFIYISLWKLECCHQKNKNNIEKNNMLQIVGNTRMLWWICWIITVPSLIYFVTDHFWSCFPHQDFQVFMIFGRIPCSELQMAVSELVWPAGDQLASAILLPDLGQFEHQRLIFPT